MPATTWRKVNSPMMTDDELLARATHFELVSPDQHGARDRVHSVVIERRTYVSDPVQSWAIVNGLHDCLNHDGEWEYEPSPSSRDDKFFQRCRWSDLHAAVAFVEDHMTRYPTGYKPE